MRRQRKRSVDRQRYHGDERWTRCPRCGEYEAWFSSTGLKGKSCKKCDYYFQGTERNPIAKRCTNGDGIIHEAWFAGESRSYLYTLCQVHPSMRRTPQEVSPNNKPMHQNTEVTCMLCISLEGVDLHAGV
jgi:hypothetical protein